MNRSRLAALIVILLALALAVFTGLQDHRAASTVRARSEALAAAEIRVPALLSYQRTSLASDLHRALEQTMGSFTDDYERVLNNVVEPTAKRRGISTKATVSAAGVVSGDRNEVVVLLFLTQVTTTRDNHSSVTGSRVEVTLRPTGDEWKIAHLQPV